MNDQTTADPTAIPVVFVNAGRVFATSRDIAAFFGKGHKDVLRAIRSVISMRPELNRRNFAPVELIDEKGEFRPAYDIDRDGFALIAMGFTGATALEFKLRYIDAFNKMEAALHARKPAALDDDAEGAATDGMKLRKVTEARLTWGERSAQQMWIAQGLETVPAMFEPARQPGLFDGARVSDEPAGTA